MSLSRNKKIILGVVASALGVPWMLLLIGFTWLILAVGCGPDPSIDERNEFVRAYLESVRDDTPFHHSYLKRESPRMRQIAESLQIQTRSLAERDLQRIEETRHLMTGPFEVTFYDYFGPVSEHGASYENGLQLNIVVSGDDGEIEWAHFDLGVLTATDRLKLYRSAFEELVEMIRADYESANVVRVTHLAIRTESSRAIPKPRKPWNDQWPITEERWETYTALFREAGRVTAIRFLDPPSGPILFTLGRVKRDGRSGTSGVAYSDEPFVDQQQASASFTFELIGDGWATFERFPRQ